MRDPKYPMDDLRSLQGTYNLAGTAFAAYLRPDGKPFGWHLARVDDTRGRVRIWRRPSWPDRESCVNEHSDDTNSVL